MDTTKLKNRLNGKVQASKEPAKENNTTETALTTVNSDYVALKNNALEIINENLKNQPLSFQLFDIIKSPSGGITSFSVPGLSGEEMEKELTGIILDYTTPRAYWDTPDPIIGTPPNCYSRDSIISHEGKACNGCHLNDFGSKNGGNGDSQAKACKEQVQMLLLRPDSIMPVIVRVPVSSKVIFQKYMIRLTGHMIPLSGVVTKITLDKATSKEGKPYALYNFEMVTQLGDDEAANAKAFGQKFKEVLNAADAPVLDIQEAG
jgi:hypothetical protein